MEETTPPAFEFYDLKNDPNENRNEINNPKYAKEIKDMKQALIQLKNKVGDVDTSQVMKEILNTHF